MIQCNRLPHFVYSISSEPNACNIIGDYRSFNCLRRFYLLRNAKKMYIENFDRISIKWCLTKYLIKFVFSVLNGFSRYHLTDCLLFGFHSTEFVCTNFVFDENGFMFESIFHEPWAVDYIVIISNNTQMNIRWSVKYPIIRTLCCIFGSIPTDYCLGKYLEVWTIWIHWIFKLKRCSKFTFNRKFIANYANGTYGYYRRLYNKRPRIWGAIQHF